MPSNSFRVIYLHIPIKSPTNKKIPEGKVDRAFLNATDTESKLLKIIQEVHLPVKLTSANTAKNGCAVISQ